jgi:hypothetical protein
MGWLLLLKAWRDIIAQHNLVGRYSSRAGSSLYFQLIRFGCADLIIFGHILCWLRHIIRELITLLAYASSVILFLLLWFSTHLRWLRIVSSWWCCYICLLLRCSWLIVYIVSLANHFPIVLVFILLKLILISIHVEILFFWLPSIPTSVHFTQIINWIAPCVSLILLRWSYILMHEILLFLNIASWLRSLLSSATCGWHYVTWLWSTALALILQILSGALLVWVIFIVRLDWVVPIILHLLSVWLLSNIVSVLNSLPIRCAWILRSLISVSVPWINRVGFSSSSCVFHFWLASFRLWCSSKTCGLCCGCQLLLWTILCGARLKIIIGSIRIQIPF